MGLFNFFADLESRLGFDGVEADVDGFGRAAPGVAERRKTEGERGSWGRGGAP